MLIYVGWIVLAMVFGSALLGMLISRALPESHLSNETKGVVTLSMGVIGTLTEVLQRFAFSVKIPPPQ